MNPVTNCLTRFFQDLPPCQRWLVGFSGGLDSTVLLHALSHMPEHPPLLAVHIHHGISVNADAWARHCQQKAADWGVELALVKVTVDRQQASLEDAARRARYRVFDELLQAGDGLLLGHHQDDQAETLLLRLMRGAGPRGLGAMAPLRTQGQGLLLRPLLTLSRALLEAYAHEQQLTWVDDDSNTDEGFDRNFIRSQISPLLARRWPGFAAGWARSAQLCREQDALLQELATADLDGLDVRFTRGGLSLDLAGLRALSRARRHNVLRQWCDGLQLPLPTQMALQAVEQQLLFADTDSQADVSWEGLSLRVFRQRLYLLPALPPLSLSTAPMALGVGESVTLAGVGELRLLPVAPELAVAGLDPQRQYRVRIREGGERCHPLGRRHSQTLKKLLQEAGLEPWLRERLPLLYCDDELAAVADLWVCQGFAAPAGQGLQLCWQPPLGLQGAGS